MKPLVFQVSQSRAAIWAMRSATFGGLVAIMAICLVAVSAIGPKTALVLLAAAILFALLSLIAALAAAISIWQNGKRGLGMLIFALFASLLLLAYPAYFVMLGFSLPMLNDVSTDLVHPPEYSAAAIAVQARRGHNPGIVSGENRQAQAKAYPDVQPILVDLDSQQAFDLALQAIKILGWRIVAEAPPGKHQSFAHIDAIDRTRLLHFTDDITLRIGPDKGKTRIDLRSSSRLGKSDFGKNAERIKKFIDEYQTLVDNL